MILVCGEALFDLFAEETGERLTFDARIGGSPFNVAVGLARLETPVAFFGALSADLFGERLRQALAREGVDTTLCPTRKALTTLSVVGLDASGSPAYAFYGDNAADRQLHEQDLPDLPDDIDMIHLGSFSALVEPIGNTLLALARREHGRRLIAYDPNVRPSVVGDLDAWRARLDELLPHVDLLKISAEDAETLYPGIDPRALARDWLSRGPRLVVVTRGGDGALAMTARQEVERPGRKVGVVDTVGAGDTFQAALLAGLAWGGTVSGDALAVLEADALDTLLARAIEAAAITCTRRGADLPRRDEITLQTDPAAASPAPRSLHR
ncbi:MAG: carbohydrate kinase [Stappia sp.]|uniref:carbohydrate kinase family protein n=1 Tax=Stappia sp. TaxID=1870903 RepID=UPI000C5FBB87|nr:carbohydrate kinase [Stappia sp.]MBM22006.1 carbohydrate kinase [Stappia sp.]